MGRLFTVFKISPHIRITVTEGFQNRLEGSGMFEENDDNFESDMLIQGFDTNVQEQSRMF